MFNPRETGLVKNIAAFEQLINICLSFGAAYNPASKFITIPEMQRIFASVKDAKTGMREDQTACTNATDTRAVTIRGTKSHARRVVNALTVLGASPEKVENANDIVKKMNGKRMTDLPESPPAKDPKDPNAKPVVTRSSAQTSYDNIMEHFAQLIELVKSEPGYKPNEPELTANGMVAKMDELEAVNKVAIDAEVKRDSSRIKCLELVYRDVTGMVDVGNAAKLYVKSVFGASSPQYRQVSKIRFRKPNKKK